MSTYERIVQLLDDGAFHAEDELRRVTRYPREWIAELQKEGQLVIETKEGLEVRLTNRHVLRQARGLRHAA